ncbi:MAG TPA: PIN domain-containing protein [Rubrivivax sp.]|nr:PIN domain-containing protein [Rubrivivax sp.]HRY86830.1 PIN domain-containing protein [Rubrivivax sp.]HRZ60463.1 PIN domain-containing protein [Rubrivivax sp.]
MIAVDANVLVYAHRRDSPFHDIARQRVARLAEGRATWALPWPCVHEFLGNVTHPRVCRTPTPLAQAIDQVDAWLESPHLLLLGESGAHWPALKPILLAARVAGPQVHDARIAALCLQHGVRELCAADRDFGRFAPLRAVNPLVTAG